MQPRRLGDAKNALIVVAFACSVAAQGVQPPVPPGTPQTENGRRLFMAYYCYSCHGTEGHGGAGPRLVVGATPDAMIRYVRKPTGGNMPAYTSKSISDSELRDIHAYLRSIPASPSARTIELLRR